MMSKSHSKLNSKPSYLKEIFRIFSSVAVTEADEAGSHIVVGSVSNSVRGGIVTNGRVS